MTAGCCSEPAERANIWNCYQTMRCLQLYITALNVVNRNLIFTAKLVCLGISITCGYAAIAHFSRYPVFGVMYYVICFEPLFAYTALYQKAFMVPYLMAKARTALRLRVQSIPSEAVRTILVKQLRSIPQVGIKVGGFHLMERTSTPAFLHYVLANIVNMLVAFE